MAIKDPGHSDGFVNDKRVPTGREGDNVPDFEIPAAGIEDVDRAVYDLFSEQIPFQVVQRGKQGNLTQPARGATESAVKVPVIFATGERFAHVKRLIPFRDNNNTIILPLISIGRKSLEIGTPSLMPSITHRAISDYTLLKRLAPEDRSYQRLLNKLRLRSSDDVASRSNFSLTDVAPGTQAVPGTVASRRNGDNLSYRDLEDEQPLLSRISDNIFEVITMPFPVFFSASYEVTFWTQYTQHMNTLLEILATARTGPGLDFKVKSKKGYFYIIEMEPSISNASNLENFSEEERIVKSMVNLKVMGYIIATQHPGQTSPLRRYLSAPVVDFGLYQQAEEVITPIDNDVPSGDSDKFLLADLKEIDPRGRDAVARGEETATVRDTIEDPFTGGRVKVIASVPRKGETVAVGRIIKTLDRFGR